jgi:type I restriction enzyme S subunit
MKWEKILLKDFVDFMPSIHLEKGENYDFIPMDIVNSGIKHVLNPEKKIYSGGGAKFCNGDTIFARITPCLENGKIAKIKNMEKGCGFGSTEFLVFRAKKNISFPDYVYYLAKTDLIRQSAIKSMVGASGRQRADKGVIQNIPVINLPLPTQRKIASILSAYDDLIENNLKRIKLLEEATQMIYQEWFVNFRFPGYENTKFVDGLPEGWEKRTMNDFCKKVTDGTHYTPKPVKHGFSLVTGKNITNGFIDFNSCYRISEENHIEVMKRSRPEKGDIIFSNIGTIGLSHIVLEEFEFSIKNVSLIKPKQSFHSSYLYNHFLNIENLVGITNQASGTSQKFISLKLLRGYKIVCPDSSILIKFQKLTEPFLLQRFFLNNLNNSLKQARDLLLPKLMTGEIEV